MYYDIHLHLDLCEFPKQVVQRAKHAGVGFLLTNGTDSESNTKALALEEAYPEVQAALGIYPNDAVKMGLDGVHAELKRIEELDPVAIGEVGLDYYHDEDNKEFMKEVFSQVIALALRIDKPLLVHSRRAEKDVVQMLTNEKDIRACMHCYGGSLKLAKRAAEHPGIYFSIPATIVRATHFQRLVEELPRENILTETDSPWLSPDQSLEPNNEPANVVRSVEVIARIWGVSVEQARQQLLENAERFLRISLS